MSQWGAAVGMSRIDVLAADSRRSIIGSSESSPRVCSPVSVPAVRCPLQGSAAHGGHCREVIVVLSSTRARMHDTCCCRGATSGTKPCELCAPWTGLKSAHQTGLLSGAVWRTFAFVLPRNSKKPAFGVYKQGRPQCWLSLKYQG